MMSIVDDIFCLVLAVYVRVNVCECARECASWRERKKKIEVFVYSSMEI